MPKGQYDHSMLHADITGRVFGRWTATKESTRRGAKGQVYWWCECSCGVKREVVGSSLRNGVSQSCGCLNSALVTARQKTHGDTHTVEHQTWNAMKQRCGNPRSTSYSRYGAKGITVCQRWEESYEAFLEDMGRRPGPGYSIDRINSNGNYEPGNCRWATIRTQNRNTGRNRVLEYDGKSMSMAEWAETMGMAYQMLNSRINTYKWSAERALTTPHRTLSKRAAGDALSASALTSL